MNQLPLLFSMMYCGLALASSPKIHIATEEFPPLSYSEGGEIKGIATDKVKCLLKAADTPYEMKIYPWTRVYNNAINKNEFCVFTTARTKERKSIFQRVSPLVINRSLLVVSENSEITINNLEEAKSYKIGVQREDAGAKELTNLGFKNLDQATSINKSVKKLESGRVDLVAMAESILEELNKNGAKLKKVATILEIEMGLACHLNMDSSLIQKMQDSLEKSCK